MEYKVVLAAYVKADSQQEANYVAGVLVEALEENWYVTGAVVEDTVEGS